MIRHSLVGALLVIATLISSGCVPRTDIFPDISHPSRANDVYSNAVFGTVLIVNKERKKEASGVLIDKKRQLVTTNAHVTDGVDRVEVIFPVKMWRGNLIVDRRYYDRNTEVLKDLGYYVSARVIAENFDSDLAILELDVVPEVAVEINRMKDCHDLTNGEAMHYIGTSKLGLWHWMGGQFRGCGENLVLIDAVTLPGNSGGPRTYRPRLSSWHSFAF